MSKAVARIEVRVWFEDGSTLRQQFEPRDLVLEANETVDFSLNFSDTAGTRQRIRPDPAKIERQSVVAEPELPNVVIRQRRTL